jgi:hypothetical protein
MVKLEWIDKFVWVEASIKRKKVWIREKNKIIFELLFNNLNF